MADKASKDSGVVGGEYVIGAMIILAALILSATIYVSTGNLQKSIEAVRLTGANAAPGGALAAPAPVFKDVKAKVERFLNANILSSQGMTANVTSISPYDDYLSVATVNVISGGKVTQTVPLYITKDGSSVLIGNAVYKTNETLPSSNPSTPPAQTAPPVVPKSATPQVTAYIMSFCPYGLQTLKAFVPVMEKLGDKANISIGFVDYSMHGYKEITGNNLIYCVQKDSRPKLTAYLRCAVVAGDYPGCLNATGIDAAKTLACADALDKQYNVTGMYNDSSTWISGSYPQYNVEKADNAKYGVQGSPTVVINGVATEIYPRSAQNTLSTVCAAFTNAPSECNQTLSDLNEAPGPGAIGSGATAATAGSGTAAGCGG